MIETREQWVLHTGGYFRPWFGGWIGMKPLFVQDNAGAKTYTDRDERDNDIRKLNMIERPVKPIQL